MDLSKKKDFSDTKLHSGRIVGNPERLKRWKPRQQSRGNVFASRGFK